MDRLMILLIFVWGFLASTVALVVTVLLWGLLAAGAYGVWALFTGGG